MKTTIAFCIICLTILINGCEKPDKGESKLKGTWVEVKEETDTIAFNEFSSEPRFHLRRGLIKMNDYLLPNYGSGPYGYELTESDSISLCYSLSSSCITGLSDSYSKYYFRLISNDTMKIGNFYNPDIRSDEILTFSKIK